MKDIVEALKAGGYTTVREVEANRRGNEVTTDVESGAKSLKPKFTKIVDLFLAPAALIDDATKNFRALSVLAKLGVEYDDIRIVNGELRIANVRKVAKAAKG